MEYLDKLQEPCITKVIKTENVGYAKANNIGFKEIDPLQGGIVVFMNPDTFLPADYLERTIAVVEQNPDAAIVSGTLLGFDLKLNTPTGKIDSTGIFRRWYGRWYDRGQGEEEPGKYSRMEMVPAICGALMCCRLEALLSFEGAVFDPDFFLYKEDIELSIRLRNGGWNLLYDPSLVAYHCRGWNKMRGATPYFLRLMSAKNEMLLYKKHPSPYMFWALVKFLLVRLFRL